MVSFGNLICFCMRYLLTSFIHIYLHRMLFIGSNQIRFVHLVKVFCKCTCKFTITIIAPLFPACQLSAPMGICKSGYGMPAIARVIFPPVTSPRSAVRETTKRVFRIERVSFARYLQTLPHVINWIKQMHKEHRNLS